MGTKLGLWRERRRAKQWARWRWKISVAYISRVATGIVLHIYYIVCIISIKRKLKLAILIHTATDKTRTDRTLLIYLLRMILTGFFREGTYFDANPSPSLLVYTRSNFKGSTFSHVWRLEEERPHTRDERSNTSNEEGVSVYPEQKTYLLYLPNCIPIY